MGTRKGRIIRPSNALVSEFGNRSRIWEIADDQVCGFGTAMMPGSIVGSKGGRVLINYYGDRSDGFLSTSGDVTHTVLNKDGLYDGDMYVANYSTLTINGGHTMTVDQPCKGLLVYVNGNCIIDGSLTMTARGAFEDPSGTVSATGIRLPMIGAGSDTLTAADFAGCGAAAIAAVANQKGISGNGKIFTIDREGGAGGVGVNNLSSGNNGGTGAQKSGGGGSGASGYGLGGGSGDGGDGTCFSGGAGSGGVYCASGNDGQDYGGAGGYANSGAYTPSTGGGAGNPGGAGSGTPVGEVGGAGTGGLLILIVGGNLTISGSGKISANGMNGGAIGGAGSGGGNVLVLYAGNLSNSGSIEADGGIGAAFPGAGDGGDGGAGSVQTAQVS